MNPTTDHTRRESPDTNSGIEHAPESAAPQAADELLSHGLLGFLHLDKAAAQEERVTRVLDAIDAESGAPIAVIRTLFNWRTCSALAATVAIIAALAVFGVPGETSGLATVQKSIAAMQQLPGDRRFEIRTQGWDETELSTEVRGTVDTRAPGLMLLKVPATDDHVVIVGADAQGRWAIRHDGGIERNRVEQAWPRFATIGDESLFADSVDRILAQAADFYTLARKADEALDGHGSIALEHIRGVKKTDGQPGPDVIDIWIDPQTRIAERVQFAWDPIPVRLDGPVGPRGQSPDGGNRPGPQRRPVHGPILDAPREDDGPPPPEARPFRQHPPRGQGDGPRGDGPGPDRPRLDDADDRPRPPRDQRGDGPGAGPRPRIGPGGFPIGPMGPKPMGPPHRILRLDRVDPPELAEGWFNPEMHAGNTTDPRR